MMVKVHDYPGGPLFPAPVCSKRHNTPILPSVVSGIFRDNDVPHDGLLKPAARTAHVYASSQESSVWIRCCRKSTHAFRGRVGECQSRDLLPFHARDGCNDWCGKWAKPKRCFCICCGIWAYGICSCSHDR